MKKLFYIFTILIPYIGWCQNNPDTLEFRPLVFIEKISDNEIKSLIKADSLNKKDFFFTEQYKDGFGLFLVKKENKNWSVYDYELYLNSGRNTVLGNIKEENNRFISIQTTSNPSGVCESHYEKEVLIDIKHNEFIDFFTFAQTKCYDENRKNLSQSKCKAKFSIKGDFLKIRTSATSDLTDCIQSGTYKYENRKFVKVK